MNNFGEHVISNELKNGFTTEFLDHPAIPPFLMNSDFMQMDKTTKVESDDLQNATDDGKKIVNTDTIINTNPAVFSQPNVYLIPTNINTNIGQVIHISNHNLVTQGNTTTNKKTNSKSDNIDDSMSKKEIELFAKEFKEKRVTLGFTQIDVSVSLADMFDQNFSQTTICRFEALQLSHNNMCRLYPFLVKWLSEADNSVNGTSQETKTTDTDTPSNAEATLVSRKRKRRASIDKNLRISLESFFMENPRPGTKDLSTMSAQLNLDRGVIRVWFCNRRQKEKKNLIAEYVNLNEKSIFIQSFNINQLNTLNHNSIVSVQETRVSETQNLTTDNLTTQNLSEYSDENSINESKKFEGQFESHIHENEYTDRNIINESEAHLLESEYIGIDTVNKSEANIHESEYKDRNTLNECEAHIHESEYTDRNTLNKSEANIHESEYTDRNTFNESEAHIHENEYKDRNIINETEAHIHENEYIDRNNVNESEKLSNQLETIMECTEKFIDNMDDYEFDHSDDRMGEENHMHLPIS